MLLFVLSCLFSAAGAQSNPHYMTTDPALSEMLTSINMPRHTGNASFATVSADPAAVHAAVRALRSAGTPSFALARQDYDGSHEPWSRGTRRVRRRARSSEPPLTAKRVASRFMSVTSTKFWSAMATLFSSKCSTIPTIHTSSLASFWR